MWLVYQDSFIAFLVLDPVGLRPYKQFFREQKGWIWFDLAGWVGAGWHNSGQTNPRPVRSHPREGQKNFMIRESLTKPWWIKILGPSLKIPNFIEYTFPDHRWYTVQQFAWDRVFRICPADISWICSVGSYGFVCDQTAGYWQDGGQVERQWFGRYSKSTLCVEIKGASCLLGSLGREASIGDCSYPTRLLRTLGKTPNISIRFLPQ